MLGIELTKSSFRIVALRRRGGSFTVLDALERPLTPQQAHDPVLLAHTLTETLLERGWQKRKAVITLSQRAALVKSFAHTDVSTRPTAASHLTRSETEQLLEMAQRSLLVPTDDLVFDYVHAAPVDPDAAADILLAGLERRAVDFCTQVAAHLPLRITALELRSLAAINGMMLQWTSSQQPGVAVAYLQHDTVTLALMDHDHIHSLHVVPLVADSAADTPQALAAELTRIFNTLKLAPRRIAAEKLLIAADDATLTEALQNSAAELQERLAIPVELAKGTLDYEWPQPPPDHPPAYGPALGAALNGLHLAPTTLNFLHPRAALTEKKKSFSWRPFVFITLGFIMLMIAFWFSLVEQRRRNLNHLEHEIAQTQPVRQKILHAKERWNLFRPYLPIQEDSGPLDGSRREHLRILAEITQLCPDPCNAYITELSISDATLTSVPIAAAANDISITGRVSKGEIVTEFIQRLNASPMFIEAKSAGTLSKGADDLLYPYSFSVTCKMYRTGAASKPATTAKP